MRTKRWILAACTGLLFVGACSSGGGKAGPAPLVEKSYIISTGDSICKQGTAAKKQAIDKFKTSNTNPSEAQALDFFTSTLLPITDQTVGAIHRIGEPTKDRTDYDTAVKELDKSLSEYKFEIGDDAVTVLRNGSKAFDSATAKFKAYGFNDCATVFAA